MNTELLMGKAREAISKLSTGQEFVVKDLFEGHEWNELPRGDKLAFGKVFKNAVISGAVDNVTHMGKRSNNSAYYRKK